jgi:cell division protein FtsA
MPPRKRSRVQLKKLNVHRVFEINSAIVNLAGTQVSSTISKGAVGISGRVIDQEDVYRALDSAQAIAVPHNREIVHVIQRGFNIDGQEDISQPIGMHGYRMEVEAHIITSAASPWKIYGSAFHGWDRCLTVCP